MFVFYLIYNFRMDIILNFITLFIIHTIHYYSYYSLIIIHYSYIRRYQRSHFYGFCPIITFFITELLKTLFSWRIGGPFRKLPCNKAIIKTIVQYLCPNCHNFKDNFVFISVIKHNRGNVYVNMKNKNSITKKECWKRATNGDRFFKFRCQ